MAPSKKPKLERLASFSSPFYPPTMTKSTVNNKYKKDENKPFHILKKTLEDTQTEREKIKTGKNVAHLFTRDFRLGDNFALSQASELAQESEVPLISLFVYSEEDFRSHSVSPFQLRYRLKSLEIVKQDLKKKNIPLYTLNVDKKKDINSSILKFLKDYEISHLFANIEYEVDELRQFIDLTKSLLENKISFQPFHDTCVVKPGELATKSKGTQYAVFTPWYRAWVAYLESLDDPFPNYPQPEANSSTKGLEKLFESKIPEPKSDFYKLNAKSLEFFDKTWSVGEHNAEKQLLDYIKSKTIKLYDDLRNEISTDATSHMSRHLASGTISSRTCIRLILENNLVSSLAKGPSGITEWIRQVSWRDFYKHVMANWPHICMFKPFQVEYDDIEWEYNLEHYQKWCEGKTGYPIVDAAMRQLNETGYLHNRPRMVVASFLSKHLLIDWRWGERYFLEHLIDGDFASNNGGWGFSSGVGVDPQPYFRIFNPWTQSEKFDKNGDYIREWVPELREIDDSKGIHNPYDHGFEDVAETNDYPRPIVDHSFARERALERYRGE